VGGAGRAEGRHGAVHVGGEDVEAAGRDGQLLAEPVAGEADEDVVDLEALHELLAGLDGADDAQPLGAGGPGLLLRGRLVGRGDEGGADHGLMAVHGDVDVRGVDDAEVDLDRMRGRGAEQGVLGELERDLGAVGGGDAEPQALEGKTDVVAVHVGEAARGGEHVLVQHAARQDAELLPLGDALGRRHLLDERRRALVVAVHLREDRVGDAQGQRVARLERLAHHPGQRLELAPVLDLVGAAGRGLLEGLHDLDGVVHVGGGAHRVLQQEVAHRHAVGVDAAHAARDLVGEAAGALRTEGAAHALLAELAAHAHVVHAVEGRALAGLARLLEHLVVGAVVTVCH